MKIIGEAWVETVHTSTHVRSETKNTKRWTVKHEHHSERSLLLSCGHTVPFTGFSKVPTTQTECWECEGKPRNEAWMARWEAEREAEKP